MCSIGAVQNIALALGDAGYAIPLSVLLFFAHAAGLHPVFRTHLLRLGLPTRHGAGTGRHAQRAGAEMGGSFAGPGALLLPGSRSRVCRDRLGVSLICRYDPFVAFFRRSGSDNMLVFGGCLLVIGLFVGRPYCRYLCPYGAILGVLSRFSKWHLRIPPAECIQCRLCEDVCPYDAIQPPTVAQPRPAPAARLWLVVMLVALPLLVVAGLAAGRQTGVSLARFEHTVRLAERVEAEVSGTVQGTIDLSDAFWNTAPRGGAFPEAPGVQLQYSAWAADRHGRLVLGLKLVHFRFGGGESITRGSRRVLLLRPLLLVCPPEKLRLGLIRDVSEVVDVTKLSHERQSP